MGVSVRRMTTEAAAAYREGRERLSAIVREAGPSAEERDVPACPGWTPKDVVGHLTGVCADVLTGRLEGVGTDQWTAAQVEERRARSLDEVLAEWGDLGAQVESLLPSFPEWAVDQMVADLLSHEHDVAGALGLKTSDQQHRPPAFEARRCQLRDVPLAP